MSQTLYPRILHRVQSGCKNADFSITFRENDNGLRCFVCFFANDVIREVSVVWEEPSPGLCDAEIKCLSCVLAILPAGQSPVVVLGCSSILFNAFSIWRKTECRPMHLPVLEYTSDVFKEHICEAWQVGTNLLDPFTILDYLLLRLVGAVQQARLMALPEFHGCLRQRQVPFASVCTVISELVHH